MGDVVEVMVGMGMEVVKCRTDEHSQARPGYYYLHLTSREAAGQLTST